MSATDLGAGADVEIEVPGFATARSGRLLDSLRETGLEPGDIDTVVYTHLHSDHVGWTTSSDQALTFADAEHIVGSAEFEFWRANPDIPFAPPAGTVLDALENRLTTASDGQTVAPGVTLRATPGHTPGHQSVIVSSGSERAVIMGDILHCPVQMVEPEWSVLFDIDADMGRRTREKLLDELEGTDVAVACGHFPEAVFGRVIKGEGVRKCRSFAAGPAQPQVGMEPGRAVSQSTTSWVVSGPLRWNSTRGRCPGRR